LYYVYMLSWIHMDQLIAHSHSRPRHTHTHTHKYTHTHTQTAPIAHTASLTSDTNATRTGYKRLLIAQQWRRLFQKPHQTAASHACTHHIRTRAEHKCVRYAPRQRCRDAAATARSTSTRSACTEPCTAAPKATQPSGSSPCAATLPGVHTRAG